jgi:hypothetical protein
MAITNKIIISKANEIGSLRNMGSGDNKTTKIGGKVIKHIYCSYDNDSVTTYVQQKEWIPTLNDYLYPPYVECEYVL